jgi:predicted permease
MLSRIRPLDQLAQDLRYAARGLRRKPGFAAAVVLTLALGTGATTAVFSVADEALLRPLPVPHADRLVNVFSFNSRAGRYVSSSLADFEELRRRTRTIDRLSAFVRFPASATAHSVTRRIAIEAVSGDYFAMLGLSPVAGRVLSATDDSPAAAPMAMIHEDYWRRNLGASPDAIGRTILLEDRLFTVVGVVPHRYRGPNLNWQDPPQVWIPLQSAPLLVPSLAGVFRARAPFLVLIGRLHPGCAVSRAAAELKTVAAGLAESEPSTNRDLTAVVLGATDSKFWPSYRGVVGRSIGVFVVAAALVLLLACANISNLLLEQAMARRREIALRLALGAGRSRLVRQLLTENVLLAVPGCLLGLSIACGLQSILLKAPNAFGLPLALDLSLNPRVGLFSAAATVAAVLLFGMAPALRAARRDILPSLKNSGNAATEGDGRLRWGLVAAQIAFSMILLTSGGLFGRSLLRAYAVDLGFRTDHLLTAGFHVQPQSAAAERMRRAQAELVRRLSNSPEVDSAALAGENLLGSIGISVPVSGDAPAPVQARLNLAGPGFFRAAGIAMAAGSGFERDPSGGPIAPAVVNRTLAARLWPGVDPVGRALRVPGGTAQVIGVARDVRSASVWEDAKPCVYLPISAATPPANVLIVRTHSAPERFIPMVRREWERLAPGVPLGEFQTGDGLLRASLAPVRVAAAGLGAFGLLAILLASLGLYGAMAYSVKQRTRELAIRVAIGADPQAVLREVLGRSLALAAVGGAVGAVGSFAAGRMLASQLHGISPGDGVTYLAIAILLALVSVAAALAPALRASRVDPAVALRSE